MAKQLNVNLSFTANTGQVRQQIQELQKQLQQLGTFGSKSSIASQLPLKKELNEAKIAAIELKTHLSQAFNQQTGSLDFTKLNNSIKQSGTSLQEYGKKLQSLGPEGQKAFATLTNAIANSEVPLKRSNAMLTEFATTMKNTVRWQFSSALMNGFVNSIQSAYNYAQNLDKSLTDIQIVTGYSADYMANFANEANKAAQALSTTTKTYADASLIYFQQGLNEEDVLKRTETTIKMAQATGDSVDQVSSYMTAIWNNFDDGSKSLEYYADVIAKLGAATASSSSEIAEGIQRFAGIGQTIGLSYEYATAALTTLTANTRQSASEIGNSLKTIFSRLQGLTLGETLEDGVDLNKYSQALAKIGVNILDTNGELLQMDDILDATAEKWDGLTQAQKVAFAETAAGTMQYTKLISLLDNWDDMKQNLNFAESASGTLEEQAEIYTESWEGAKKRVQAAWEEIYNDLIDKDVIKSALNSLEDILGFVDQIIDSVGGLKGVLLGIGVVLTSVFSKQLSQGLSNLTYNLNMATQMGQKQQQAEKNKFLNQSAQEMAGYNEDIEIGTLSQSEQQRIAILQDEIDLKQQLVDNAERMSEAEQSVTKELLDQQKALGEQVVANKKEKEDNDLKKSTLSDEMMTRAYAKQQDSNGSFEVKGIQIKNQKNAIKEDVTAIHQLDSVLQKVGEDAEKISLTDEEFAELNKTLQKVTSSANKARTAVEKGTDVDFQDVHLSLQDMDEGILDLGDRTEITVEKLQQIKGVLSQDLEVSGGTLSILTGGKTDEQYNDETIQNYIQTISDEIDIIEQGIPVNQAYGDVVDKVQDSMANPKGEPLKWSDGLVKAGQGIASLIFSVQSLASVMDTINDPDMSAWEKTTTIFMSLTTAIPALAAGIIALKDAHLIATAKAMAHNIAESALAKTAVVYLAKLGLLTRRHLSEAAALNVTTVAQKGLNAAMESNPVGAIIAGIATLVTVLGALGTAIYKIAKSYTDAQHKGEKELAASQKATENFKDALDDTRAKTSEIQSDFDNYTSVVEALESCTTGTQQWVEKMEEVQAIVTDLLEKYPTLAQYVQFDENGNMTLSSEGFDAVMTEQKKNELVSQGAAYLSTQQTNALTIQQKKEEVESLKNDLSSDLYERDSNFPNDLSELANKMFQSNEEEATQYFKNALEKGIEDPSIQDVLEMATYRNIADSEQVLEKNSDLFNSLGRTQEKKDILQPLVADKTLIRKIPKTDGEQELKEKYDFTIAEFLQATEEILDKYSLYEDTIKKQTEKANKAQEELSSSKEEADTTKENNGYIMASQLLQNKEYVQSMSNLDAFFKRAGEQYNNLADQMVEEINNSYDSNYEDIFKNYLKFTGEKGNISNIEKNEDGDITGYKINGEEQEVQEGEFSKQTLVDWQATMNVVEEFPQKIEEGLLQALQNSSKGIEDFCAGAIDVSKNQLESINNLAQDFGISKNLDNMSYGQSQILTQAGITSKNISSNQITADDLGITNDMAVMLGYNSADAYLTTFGEALSTRNKIFDQLQNIEGFTELPNSITDQMTIEMASSIQSLVKEMEFGPLGESSGKILMAGINTTLRGADAEQIQDGLQAILNIDWTSNDSINSLIGTLDDLGIQVDATSANWQTFIGQMRADYGTIKDISDIKINFDQLLELQDAQVGDTVKTEDIESLLVIFPQLSNYLIDVDDKTKAWITDFSNLQGMDLINIIGQLQTFGDLQDTLSNPEEGNLNLKELLEDMDTEDLSSMQEGLRSIFNDTNSANLCEQLGYSKEALEQLLNTGSQEQLAQLYTSLTNFMNGDYSISAEMAEKMANTAKSVQELQEMWDSGSLGDNVDAFNKKFQQFQDLVDEDVDTDELEDLAEYLQENCDQIEGLNKELKNNAKQAKKTAEEILRYDHAVESITESYEDWLDALEADDLQEQAKVGKELANVYGDMFNLDGSVLSDSFLTNVDNLRLLQDAANNVEGAYEELQSRVQEDIEARLDLDGTNFYEEKAAVEAALDEMNYDDLEIGAELNADGFYTQLENLVNAAGMSATEATNYLASMGVDATVEEVETDATEENEVTGVTAQVTQRDFPMSIPSVQGGSTLFGMTVPTLTPAKTETGFVSDVTYSEDPLVTQDKKQNKAFTLKVTSANKSSGGNFKYKNSSNGGGSRSSGGRRSGGGNRGGGSGRTARRNTGQMKQSKDEIGRYHTLDKQLNTLTKQYDKISKAKDRAYGVSKIKLMDQEIKKQEQIIKKQKEYLKAAKENLKLDKQNLKNGKTTYTDENGNQKTVASGAKNYLKMDVKFDDDGNITNYEELMQAAIDKYNKAVAEFNSKNTDDETAKAAMEAAQQQYDGFIAWLEQYEETQELVEDKAQELIDAQNEAYDLRFEKTEYIVSVKLEVNDKDLEYLEYLLSRLEDDSHDAIEAIGLLGDTVQTNLDRRDTIKTGLNDLFNNGNHKNLEGQGDLAERLANGDQEAINLVSQEEFTEDEVNFIQDQMSELLNINQALDDARKQVFERMDSAWDTGLEKMNQYIDGQKHLLTMTESWGNVVDLVGKKTLGITSEQMKQYRQNKLDQQKTILQTSVTKRDTLGAQLDEAKAKRDELEAKRQEALKKGDQATADSLQKDIESWDESIQHYEEDYREACETTEEEFATMLEMNKETFEANLQDIVDDFSAAIGGQWGSIEGLQEQMDLQQKIAERYVPEYERVYQLSKLTRDITKSIDETSNIKAKRELAKLQEEIVGWQEEGKELSEYDLTYARQRYELKLAEIALEEAQNAKSQVRMTKDSEGNFSYVYTADEDKVAEAEQSYEDKLYEMQKTNAEYINEIEQNMVELQAELQQKFQEYADIYGYGTEEYEKACAEYQEYYTAQMEYYSGELNKTLTNNTTLYEEDVKNYATLHNNKAMADQEYVGSFEQTQLAIATGYTNLDELCKAWVKSSEESFEKARTLNSEYQASTKEAFEAAGKDYESYGETMVTETGKMLEESKKLQDDFKQTAADGKQMFTDIVSAAQQFVLDYGTEIDKIVLKNNALYESFQKVLKAWSEFEEKEETPTEGGEDPEDKEDPESTKENGDGGGRRSNADKAEGVAAAIWIWGNRSGWGVDPERAKKLKAKGVSAAQTLLNQKEGTHYFYNKYWDKRNEVLNKYGYGKFDTGGYTGDWSGEGRFAMLHQKEIVLNADDTENFLKTVDIVRQISDMIDLNAMSASGGLGSLFATSVKNDSGQLEQNVHITAEFPNATDKNEILAAFDNIVNLASQYANVKR